MNDFEKYQLAKSQFEICYKGYAINKILALTIWQLANGNLSLKLKHFAKALLAYRLNDIIFDKNNHKILSTFGTYKRKDHQDTYNHVLRMLGPSVAHNELVNANRCFYVSIKTIVFVILRALPLVVRMRGIKASNKLYLLLDTIFWCNTINILYKRDFSGVQKYLCFCDVLDLENLLTQHFKKMGIPTYSLTHGTHHIIRITPEPGMLGYENLETEHLLMWGQYSIDEYANWGISTNRLYLAGYPKANKQVKVRPSNGRKRCVVLLSQHYFCDLNMRLLGLLSDYSDLYDFTLKPHPAAVEYYKDYATNHNMSIIDSNEVIDKCLDQERFDWCIAVNTGAYYEALMKGLRCLRYSDGSFDEQPGCNDIFGNREQFEIKINELFDMPVEVCQREIDNALRYAYGVGINNYYDIIINT